MSKKWTEKTLGDVLELAYGKSLPKKAREAGPYPVYGSNGVVDYHIEAAVRGPGIIVGRKGSCGEVHYCDSDFWPIDTTYYVDLKRDDNLRFIAYLLSSLGLNKMNAHSTIPGLNREHAYCVPISLPTLPEQKKIAAVLLKIQKAIETQEKIIQSLRDLKKSTMHFVFSRGLRGEKTKLTEIGEIPESWEVVKIGSLGKIITGTTPRTEVEKYWGGSHPFITPLDIGDSKYVCSTERFVTDAALQVARPLPAGAIAVTCIGYIGKVGIVRNDNSITNQQINAVVSKPNCDNEFLYYLFLQHARRLDQAASQTTVPILNKNNFAILSVALPVLREQIEIRNTCSAVDRKLELHKAKKSSLQDLFKTMLNKLMTGEIRVKDLDIDVKEVET